MRNWFRDGSFRQLFRHSGVLVAGDVAANAISLVSLALTARALGAELLGVLVLIQTYTGIIDKLVNFQTWKALIKFGAGAADSGDKDTLRGLFRIGLGIDVLSALAAFLICIGGTFVVADVKELSTDITQMMLLYSFTVLFHLAGTPTAALRIYERFTAFSIQKTSAAVVKLAGVLLAVALDAGLWGFLIVWLCANVVGHLVLFFLGLQTLWRNGIDLRRRASIEWRPVVRFAFWTNLVTTFSLPIRQVDMFIVGGLVSIESVGVYKIIKQIALAMTMVSDSVYQVIYPRFAGMLSRREIDQALRMAVRTGAVLLVFALSMASLLSLTAPIWLSLVFGQDFVRDLASLSLYLFLRSISCGFVVVHPLFLAMGFVRREVGILLVSSALYLTAAYYLGSAFGLVGIVAAYGVQFSSVLVPKLYTIRSALRQPEIVT